MSKRRSLALLLLIAGSAITVSSLSPGQSQETVEGARPATQPLSGASKPASQAGQDKTERQLFMRGKLAMVQKIVEGITTEDYEMIDSGGLELATLTESAAWKSDRDPYYQYYSRNFEQAVKGLISAAKSESVEKATFAYVHVTISCTACHQHVRGTVRTAR